MVCYKEVAVIDVLSAEFERRRLHLAEDFDEWLRLQADVKDRTSSPGSALYPACGETSKNSPRRMST